MRRPIQDELVSSVWVRTARRAGLPIGALTAALLGRKWYPGFFQGGHLNELAGFVGSTAEVLLQDHTVFPYSSAFYSLKGLATARSAALSVGLRARAAGAVTQGTSDMVRRRRWCPKCAESDLETWGESVWRRAHNLPGVLLCLKHDTPLRESSHRTSGTGVWTTDLPHECGRGRQLAARPTPFLREMARGSLATLHTPPADCSPSWYRARLLDAGLLSPERDVNADGLVEWARGSVGSDLQLLGFRDADVALKWLPLMVRPRTDVPFVPLKHVLFRTVLRLHAESTGQTVDHVPSGPVNAGQEPPLCDGEDADLSFHAGASRRIASRATDR